MHIFEQGTVKIKEALIDFYKGMFNFLGVTTRRGFGWGILIGFLCLFPFFYLLIALSSKFQEFSVICLIIIAMICITIFVPSGEFKIQNENKFLEFWMIKKGELQ